MAFFSLTLFGFLLIFSSTYSFPLLRDVKPTIHTLSTGGFNPFDTDPTPVAKSTTTKATTVVRTTTASRTTTTSQIATTSQAVTTSQSTTFGQTTKLPIVATTAAPSPTTTRLTSTTIRSTSITSQTASASAPPSTPTLPITASSSSTNDMLTTPALTPTNSLPVIVQRAFPVFHIVIAIAVIAFVAILGAIAYVIWKKHHNRSEAALGRALARLPYMTRLTSLSQNTSRESLNWDYTNLPNLIEGADDYVDQRSRGYTHMSLVGSEPSTNGDDNVEEEEGVVNVGAEVDVEMEAAGASMRVEADVEVGAVGASVEEKANVEMEIVGASAEAEAHGTSATSIASIEDTKVTGSGGVGGDSRGDGEDMDDRLLGTLEEEGDGATATSSGSGVGEDDSIGNNSLSSAAITPAMGEGDVKEMVGRVSLDAIANWVVSAGAEEVEVMAEMGKSELEMRAGAAGVREALTPVEVDETAL